MAKIFYVVATPIGNLGDITERAKSVLGACETVAAEDTRVARRLLSALGIKGKRYVSVREHNEASAAARLAAEADGDVCYVSDAGTPGISDPGARAVAAFRKAGWKIIPIPGACAAVAAASVAGILGEGLVFLGFLPRKAGARRERLHAAAATGLPVVFYSSPRTVANDLQEIAKIDPSTEVSVGRELTKMHETVVSGAAGQIALEIASNDEALRGEYTVVVASMRQTGNIVADKVAVALSEYMPSSRAKRIAAKITKTGAQ